MGNIEICSPAGNLDSLKSAINNGADAVYLGFNNSSNLRNFPGLNFTKDNIKKGLNYARSKGKKIYITVNSYPQEKELKDCIESIDESVRLGVDAIILSDIALLNYVSQKYPSVRIHLSVQSGVSNLPSIEFYQKRFNIKRVILPRIMTLDEITELKKNTTVEIEIFIIGLLCINCEGRCFLSSFLTSESINTYGACSHPRFIRFNTDSEGMKVTSNGKTLNIFKEHESASYPTPCKGRYYNEITKKYDYMIQDPESLNLINIFPKILSSGIDALKIEGRQRSCSYVSDVTRIVRNALDSYRKNNKHEISETDKKKLFQLFEGMSPSYGCYQGK